MSEGFRKRYEKELRRKKFLADLKDRYRMVLRFFGVKPMQYKQIPVEDWDERTRLLSAFRKAYGEYFSQPGIPENSELQSLSTQLLWHRVHLQKLRMNRLGVTMNMESLRVKREPQPEKSVERNAVFDGRYLVEEINEAIYAKRSFVKQNQVIGEFRDHESVDYSVLSAKQEGKGEIICPNCGARTTRENLIDGCDHCGTKFTVEDLADKVGGFDFVIEILDRTLQKTGRQVDLSLDEHSAATIRKYDPNFSFRSFKANLYNKLAAIHFADSYAQISAFSDEDLSHLKETYGDIVNIDFDMLQLWDHKFRVEDGMQKVSCTVRMVLFGLVDGRIRMRNETVALELERSADCLTQNICGPSVLKCRGCGSSLSLMDGRTCPYCGNELDMKQYDWVITGYESRMNEYGKSWRIFN